MSDGMRAVRGDITRLVGFAIVRCVVAGEKTDPTADPILRTGGDQLVAAIARHEPLAEARPVVTPPFRLPASAVIHVAAPAWRGGTNDEDRRLALTVERVLAVARRSRLTHIAFSPIGPGFPLARATTLAVDTVHSALFAAPEIVEVLFVCPTAATLRSCGDAIAALLD